MRHSYLFIGILFGCLLCPLVAMAGVRPAPVVLRFNGEVSQDFTVTNEDPRQAAYVNMRVEAYQQPSKTADKTTANKPAVVLDPRESGLLLSPTKLVLPPGGSRLVRVRLIQPPGEVERRYTIRVTPVDGELVPSLARVTQVRAGVRMIIAYGVVVIVAPAAAVAASHQQP